MAPPFGAIFAEDVPAPDERSHHVAGNCGDWRVRRGECCALLAAKLTRHAEYILASRAAVAKNVDERGATKTGRRARAREGQRGWDYRSSHRYGRGTRGDNCQADHRTRKRSAARGPYSARFCQAALH